MKRLVQPGLSVTLCIGRYGGFYFRGLRRGDRWFGVCLGWIAITIYTLDVECMIDALVERAWPDEKAVS